MWKFRRRLKSARDRLRAEDWSTDTYGSLTRNSSALLDFPVQSGLSLAISKAPAPHFSNSGTLTAWQSELPAELLAGCVSYITCQPGISLGASRVSPGSGHLSCSTE